MLRKISHILGSSIDSSGNKAGYRGKSIDSRYRTAESRATDKQGSGAYWRSITGTQRKGANEEDNGSEVEPNDVKSGQVMKTQEIRISIETSSQDGSREYPSGSGRPMGMEVSIIA